MVPLFIGGATMIDCLARERIKEMLRFPELCPAILEEASSTNTLLRELAVEGVPEGTLLVTDYQTAGRGRRGRSFYSPKGTGLYMSLLLRPAFGIEQAVYLTTACAVAAAEAVEACGVSVGIKWVNDLYLNDRKVAGILTEAIDGGIIVGIGFNLYQPKDGFPAELESIATAVFSEETENLKNRLAAEWVNRFWTIYKNLDPKVYLDRYRSRSILTDRRITMLRNDEELCGIVRGINERCELVVELDDGKCQTLSSGEVQIRFGNN